MIFLSKVILTLMLTLLLTTILYLELIQIKKNRRYIHRQQKEMNLVNRQFQYKIFSTLFFENGVFENTNKFTIETNFGYPLPEKEMVDFEVYIKEKIINLL